MIELFTNPGYVAAGGALISAPIIIHLINRMRFKRLRWAAMEFLLKAQKRSRRRLIIEQLLLLALRCLLVLLTALLVGRFLGFSFGSTADQETLHVVLLDDTLSMTDKQDKDGAPTCFKVAKDVITKKIVDNLKQSNGIERLTIIPLSKLVTEPDYKFKTYGDLGERDTVDKINKDLAELQPTRLHVELLHGLNKANDLIRENPESKVVVHVLSDFRKDDWTGARARGLHQALLKMTVDNKRGVTVRLIDTVAPNRVEGQGGVPTARDNLAIVDFQATNRVVPRSRRAEFRITVANYSTSEASVRLVVHDDKTGKVIDEGDFLDRMPLVVPAMGTATARFATPTGRFEEGAGEDQETIYARLSAHLVSPDRTTLKNDGIAEDNVRHASVELRDQVPILLVDSRGAAGMKLEPVLERPVYDMSGKLLRIVKLDIPDKRAGDSLAVSSAVEREIIDPIKKTARPIYKAVLGYKHELAVGGDARTVLTSPDLDRYQSIILMDVPSLEKEQLARLEKYVQNGGGVAFFLGPNVNVGYYNENLYKKGEGLFPVPLAGDTFPTGDEAKKGNVVPRRDPFQFQLLLREDLAPSEDQVLIFGPLLRQNKNQIGWLKVAPWIATSPPWIGSTGPAPRARSRRSSPGPTRTPSANSSRSRARASACISTRCANWPVPSTRWTRATSRTGRG